MKKWIIVVVLCTLVVLVFYYNRFNIINVFKKEPEDIRELVFIEGEIDDVIEIHVIEPLEELPSPTKAVIIKTKRPKNLCFPKTNYHREIKVLRPKKLSFPKIKYRLQKGV